MRKSAILKLVAFGFALSLVPLINGCSEDTTTAPQSEIQDTTPPTPPVGLEVARRDKGVKVSWSPNLESDLVGYNLWIYVPSPNLIQAYQKLNTELITTSEYSTSKLPKGDPSYYFRLTAVDQFNNESAFSTTVEAQVPYILSQQ